MTGTTDARLTLMSAGVFSRLLLTNHWKQRLTEISFFAAWTRRRRSPSKLERRGEAGPSHGIWPAFISWLGKSLFGWPIGKGFWSEISKPTRNSPKELRQDSPPHPSPP